MITKKDILKWLEQFDDDTEIDYTVSLFAEPYGVVHLLDMDEGLTFDEASSLEERTQRKIREGKISAA